MPRMTVIANARITMRFLILFITPPH